MGDLTAVSSFGGLCLLLLLGKAARVYIPLFQKLFLPSSVLGGLLGLVFLQLAQIPGDESDTFYGYLEREWIQGWKNLSGFLINIVFGALFLGVKVPPLKTVWNKSGPQLMYGMVVAWGQWSTALLFTGAILIPAFGVNKMFASIIPIGFAGGHGTAAGMASTYTNEGWPEGGDFALASATVGLVCSILLGVMWVNIAVRRGWVKVLATPEQAEEGIPGARPRRNSVLSISAAGLYQTQDRPVLGMQTTRADSIDSFALHLAIVGIAILIGFCIKQAMIAIENTSEAMQDVGFFSGFPMFSLCMAGGILIQVCVDKCNPRHAFIDATTMERVSGTALDFLITAAVASVDVKAISDDIVPFIILVLTAFLWQFFALVYVAPYVLPNHWFERSIAEFGMNMGVIASGLVLLRMADPDSKTPAPGDFAYKQLMHSPFMGGGIWTAAAVPLLSNVTTWPMFGITASVTLGWLAVWFFHFRPKYGPVCGCKHCIEFGDREGAEAKLLNSNSSDHYVASDMLE